MKTGYWCNEAVARVLWQRAWAVLLTLLVGYACLPAVAEECVARGLGSPPRMAAMPEKYHRTMADSYKDYFLLRDVVVLQGGEWVVAMVEHADPIRNMAPAPPSTFAARTVASGWLAIGLRTGRSIYLEPPQSRRLPKDVQLGRAGFHDRLCSWRTGSCAVGVQIVSGEWVRNATPDSLIAERGQFAMNAFYLADKRWFLWEWHPDEGKLEPLDWYAPVDSLVEALEGTSYEVKSWHPRLNEAEDWIGRIQLHNRDSGQDVALDFSTVYGGEAGVEKRSGSHQREEARPADQRLTPRIPIVGYSANEMFGPTEDQRSIIVLNRFRWEHNAPILWRIDLADGLPVPWQYDREAIEKRVGGPVGLIRLIRGPKRPCRYLPLIILKEQEKRGPKRVLWMLDSKTGDLAGPQSLPWGFDGNAFDFECTFEGITLHASGDGHLLTYYTELTGNRDFPQIIVVYDTTKKRSVGSRQPRSCEVPVGFDATGNVILANSYRVLRWRAPFTDDWEVVYSLEKQQ